MFRAFRKRRQPGLQPKRRWDDAPDGEVETLLKIKQLCSVAKESAERRAQMLSDGISTPALSYETNRYRQYFKRGFDLSQTLTDRYYHDAALQFLIGVALAAHDEDYAKLLFRGIEAKTIRKAVLNKHPRLRVSS